MAVYPVNQGGRGSVITVVPDSGIEKAPMSDGAESAYTDFAETRFNLTIEHYMLGQADRDALFAFYDTQPVAVHSVATVLEGNYNCLFNNRPRLTKKSGNLANVVTEMTGVKAASGLTVIGSSGVSFAVGVTVLGSGGKSFVVG